MNIIKKKKIKRVNQSNNISSSKLFKKSNKFFFKYFLILFLSVTFSVASAQNTSFFDSANYCEQQNIDVKLFRTINNNRSDFLNTLIPITDKSLLPVSIGVPAGLFTLSRINEKYYDENSAILTGVSELTGFVITFSVKNIVKRERPFRKLNNVYLVSSKPLIDRFSFPSGHTTISFALATSLTLRYPDKPVLISGLYLYAVVVSLGRIYLGVHYPSDVLGGMIVGSGSALLIHSLRKEIINAKNNLFREQGRKDSNTSSNLSLLIFSSMISTDIINYFFSNSSNQVLNNSSINFSVDGKINRFNFSYNY